MSKKSCLILTLALYSSCVSVPDDVLVENRAEVKTAPTTQAATEFLSDTDAAYEYLEKIQHAALGKASESRQKEIAEKLDDVRFIYREIYKNKSVVSGSGPGINEKEFMRLIEERVALHLPTRYEDPFTNIIMEGLTSKILKACDALSLELSQTLRFGTIHHPIMNAYTIAVPDSSEHLVVVSDRLFSFIHEMAKVALSPTVIEFSPSKQAIEYNMSETTAANHIRANPELQRYFVSMILDFLLIVPGEHRIIGRDIMPLVSALVEGSELFIVGHEFGHVIGQHVPKKMTLFKLNSPAGEHRDEPPERVVRSWRQEVEADIYGFQLMMTALGNNSQTTTSDISLLAPLFFFKCVEILEKAKFLLENGVEENSLSETELTKILDALISVLDEEDEYEVNDLELSSLSRKYGEHPPVFLRHFLLSRLLESAMPDDGRGLDPQAIQLSSTVERNLDLFWMETVPTFEKLAHIIRNRQLEIWNTRQDF